MKKQIIILEIWSDETTRWLGTPRNAIQHAATVAVAAMTEGPAPKVEAHTLPKGTILTITEGDE